ncbi:MAG: hypothetical protein A2654_02420 [Candidatus Nealsonbacteria bacterium RIFCSPHIGHO2_01_FULL_43_31]|uniref:3D domain-containing protein n=1 Tax=Candidatus Nealsonbacteria bacterium RIFCSPHIGHO2_01_FULL_43_31 TaxID=1801665 RepID=A0A1G2E2D0_9BACT|nr:MAG: hypothetical protein A2654_02420 [Candidatus Nealsonbacteria bacterium RIFCSPHIGHO2_01_FULL_43_31]
MLKILKLNTFWLHKATIVVITLVLTLNSPIMGVSASWGYNDVIALINNRPEIRGNLFLVTGGDSLMGVDAPLQQKTIRAVLTAYSSTPDQTDDTPFITASNTRVRDGIVAANFLAFGTKVQIPEIFGDKVFTVEDRMAKKHNDKIDIWFPERHLAKKFGIQEAEVIVFE